MTQLAFHIDSSICTGCRCCELACKGKYDLPIGMRFRKVRDYCGGGWVPDVSQPNILVPQNVFSYSISVSCMHCANPICVEVCPTTAMTKRDEDGIVYVDTNYCVGCHFCAMACPYGAPQFSEEDGMMHKCDFCMDYLEKGEDPACVEACPQRCLHFGDIEELQAEYGNVIQVAPLPDPALTSPNVVITPHKDSVLDESRGGYIMTSERGE